MKGIAYGVGVGPGDPELMTLKAVRLIRENEVIAVPGKDPSDTVAYQIAVQVVPELAEKTLIAVDMPMTTDREKLAASHRKNAAEIASWLDRGENVVYLTLGDPTVYCTFTYLQEILEDNGYETRLVSGVTSFCAAAARLNIPVVKWNEPMHVIPAAHKLEEAFSLPGTYVLMKSASHMQEVKDLLDPEKRDIQAVINCGMPDELVCRSVDEIPDKAGYFSLVIAREKNSGAVGKRLTDQTVAKREKKQTEQTADAAKRKKKRTEQMTDAAKRKKCNMIELCGLTKKFGDFTAVDHIDLQIETGEFFGLLGPNGAGKTTTISMLSTVLLPTEGEVRIDGRVLDRRASREKQKLSVITQEYSMRQDMTIDEVMEYQGRLYFLPKKVIRQKTEELLEFAGLLQFRKRIVRHLSGGMKRKVMICRALMTEPEILLLDEPTAGMDAVSRRQMWNLLRQLNGQRMTIVLTTHFIDEAQALCGRVALMNQGKLAYIDTPESLIQELGAFAVDEPSEEMLHSSYFHTREEAIGYLSSAGGHASLRRTTLEDVFVERIGRRL